MRQAAKTDAMPMTVQDRPLRAQTAMPGTTMPGTTMPGTAMPGTAMPRLSALAFAAFAGAGLIIIVTLSGTYPTEESGPAYLNRGQTITVGGQSLDLSKPIFITGRICSDTDAGSGDAADGPAGCIAANRSLPVTVVTLGLDAQQRPIFQVEAETTAGTTQGWARFGDLSN
jgi:hypothetical protein